MPPRTVICLHTRSGAPPPVGFELWAGSLGTHDAISRSRCGWKVLPAALPPRLRPSLRASDGCLIHVETITTKQTLDREDITCHDNYITSVRV